jgi:glycosyltransferase involved in cell wall biosynthesis
MQATFLTRLERNVDVIAIQDWLSGIAGLNLAKNRQAPIVFHIHSAEWGRQPHDGGSPAVRAFEGGMAWEADAVITVSHPMRDDLLAHGWNPAKVHAVWNGVDPKRYQPAAVPSDAIARLRSRYGIPAGVPVALYVGRMVPEKGVVALVEAMVEVRQHVPDAHLVILGVGQTETDCRDRVARFALEDRVHFRNELVPETERIAHYAMCDVGVFPSTYEPFGIVTLEAMAMGKACVAGARGVVGFREQVVTHGPAQTGLHVNGGDAGDIAWGLCEAFRDRDRLAAWGAAGRARVEAMFTWADSARATEAVYQRVTCRYR